MGFPNLLLVRRKRLLSRDADKFLFTTLAPQVGCDAKLNTLCEFERDINARTSRQIARDINVVKIQSIHADEGLTLETSVFSSTVANLLSCQNTTLRRTMTNSIRCRLDCEENGRLPWEKQQRYMHSQTCERNEEINNQLLQRFLWNWHCENAWPPRNLIKLVKGL